MRRITSMAAMLATALTASAATAQTEINWWHAMGGRLGEIVDEFAAKFNAEQEANAGTCTLTATYKGNYTETMTAAPASLKVK